MGFSNWISLEWVLETIRGISWLRTRVGFLGILCGWGVVWGDSSLNTENVREYRILENPVPRIFKNTLFYQIFYSWTSEFPKQNISGMAPPYFAPCDQLGTNILYTNIHNILQQLDIYNNPVIILCFFSFSSHRFTYKCTSNYNLLLHRWNVCAW